MAIDGSVKYTIEHKKTPAIDVPHWDELNNARTRLHQLGLVGITNEGIGYGNLSIRLRGYEFLITGTSTGALKILTRNEYCLVNIFDLEKNHVISTGPIQASSESMTHGAIYQASPDINCVIHIHSRIIFDAMLRDNYPSTPTDAKFGTPEIAYAVKKCAENLNKAEGAIVLAGHDEGIIAYGSSVENALNLILELNNKYKE